tara:strand:+ start:395 stop:1039 length:645 start_codon:yes stop_codon:yes gene_type:complete
MRFNYDFSKGTIKHLIEAEFYNEASKVLPKTFSSTIITGPDFKRHVDNMEQYLKCKSFTICELNTHIFVDIFNGLKDFPLIKVKNENIKDYGTTFIDCDLTCVSDIEAIKATLLKQIETQSTCNRSKVFIFSFSLRTSSPKSIDCYIRPLFGLLGSHISSIKLLNKNALTIKTKINNYCNSLNVNKTKGRIINYKLYSYNAGGGPMLTCYIEYK